jgi:hypothetical protein
LKLSLSFVRRLRGVFTALVVFSMLCNTSAIGSAAPPGAPCSASNQLDLTARPGHGAALVLQICGNGTSLASAAGEGGTIRVGDELPDGTTLSTPPGVTVDFISSNGNVIRAYSGNTWRLGSQAKGDFITAVTGKLDFLVRHALGAFGVYAAPVYGLVPGTDFSVDSHPGASVSFAVTDGRVRLTRQVTVHLQAENRDVEGIRQTDYISASGPEPSSVTYVLPLQALAFASALVAKNFFAEQLRNALQIGDQGGIEDSSFNSLRVEETLSPPAAPHSNAPSQHPAAQQSAATQSGGATAGSSSAAGAGAGAGAGAAAGTTWIVAPLAFVGALGVGIATGVVKLSSPPPARAAGPPAGSITVKSMGRHPSARFHFSFGLRL